VIKLIYWWHALLPYHSNAFLRLDEVPDWKEKGENVTFMKYNKRLNFS